MGLAEGDAFASGSILSYQQAERIRDNWRAASAPSNPQAGSLWSDSVNEKLFHHQASAWMEIIQADNFYLSTVAGGGYALRIDAYQDDVTALTGLLRGAYIQASNGDQAATGTIRALELKARAGRPGEDGANVAVLEGLSISADAKTYDITTVMRGAEISLDGESGSTITKAVGLRIAQNFQADIATLCYGLEFYRDSFENDADLILSSGGLIGGKAGHLRLTDAGILELYDAALVDKLFLYHNGTDAYFKWTDGSLVLMTDEGTNTMTFVDIKGKGTSYGTVRIYDEDNNEYLGLAASGGEAYISTYGISPATLRFQHSTPQDIKCWAGISSGNPYFYIHGYKTADTVKYGRLFVDTVGHFIIDTEIKGILSQGGSIVAKWSEGIFNLLDDNLMILGDTWDCSMGWLNASSVFQIVKGYVLGSNVMMSINATGLSFFGVAPVAQAGHIGDTGGDDAAVVNAILVVLEDLGLIASA